MSSSQSRVGSFRVAALALERVAHNERRQLPVHGKLRKGGATLS
jgi:hypothetical protein